MSASASASAHRRGAFIVLEGLDRTGKTTQCQRLVERLRRHSSGPDPAKVEGIRFPDRSTSIGKMIDGYLSSATELDDRAVHLLFCANRWERSADIPNRLRSGTTIVCDRYAFSGIAFTAAKTRLPSTPLPHEPLAILAAPDAGLPLPDLVVYLSISPEKQAERGGFGLERYEKAEVQATVRKVFESTASASGEEEGVAAMVRRLHGNERWATVSAEGSLGEVEDQIWKAVLPTVERLSGQSLATEDVGKLWMEKDSGAFAL